jgi:hypothetical protein
MLSTPLLANAPDGSNGAATYVNAILSYFVVFLQMHGPRLASRRILASQRKAIGQTSDDE